MYHNTRHQKEVSLWLKKIIMMRISNELLLNSIIMAKTQASLIKEYGVSQTALSRWIKQYSTVETSNGEILTAKQIQELQKRNAQLEEENLILKKRLPSSRHTQTKIKRSL